MANGSLFVARRRSTDRRQVRKCAVRSADSEPFRDRLTRSLGARFHVHRTVAAGFAELRFPSWVATNAMAGVLETSTTWPCATPTTVTSAPRPIRASSWIAGRSKICVRASYQTKLRRAEPRRQRQQGGYAIAARDAGAERLSCVHRRCRCRPQTSGSEDILDRRGLDAESIDGLVSTHAAGEPASIIWSVRRCPRSAARRRPRPLPQRLWQHFRRSCLPRADQCSLDFPDQPARYFVRIDNAAAPGVRALSDLFAPGVADFRGHRCPTE